MRYHPSSLEKWKKISQRHHIRDSVFLPRIIKHFRAGSVLELGAGCGQISEKLQTYGFEVVASDLESFFIEHMREKGLSAYVIDALNIKKSMDRKFDNVFCQGLVPFMSRSPGVAQKTYDSVYQTLKVNGRFISICSSYFWRRRKAGRTNYLSLKEQMELIHDQNKFQVITVIKHQIFPTALYTEKNKHLLNYLDFELSRIFPNRYILILKKR